jgi:hypothetical protein
MTPTKIADDAFVTNAFDSPYFEAIAGGTVTDEYGFCDTSGVEAAGYKHL